MPMPTSFTEQSLAEYMQVQLRALGEVAGWSAASMSYTWPVNHTLLEYGVQDIAEATNIKNLLMLAEVMALRAATTELSVVYDSSDESSNEKRSQMFVQASKLLDRAEARAKDAGLLVVEATGRRPVVTQITKQAPISAPVPGAANPYPYGPDANDPRFSGSPYRRSF